MCAVKKYNNSDDVKGKIIMSCMEPVSDGMRISTDDEEVLKFRANIIESLMTNHPHDCPVCDEGGECHLQDMTVMSGHNYRRFNFNKRTYKNQFLGPFINHEMNRCIQCYRCVRFYKDYAGGKDLDVFGSRNSLYFGRFEEGKLESEFSGNLAEVCPTGVFTDKTLKYHYTRKWDMTNSPSVCPHCSLGCNIFVSERYGSVRRVSNRYNSEVNGYFICDRGRFGYEYINSKERIKNILFRNNEKGQYDIINDEELLDKLKPILQSQSANTEKRSTVLGIGSPRASVESNFVLKQLVGKDNFYIGTTQNEYILTKQILDNISQTPAKIYSLKEIEKADAVLILGEDITNTAPMAALAVRQAVKNRPLEKADKLNIPRWNDQAVKNLIQDENGPLIIANTFETKLDDISCDIITESPQDISRFAFAVANILNSDSPAVNDISPELLLKAKKTAQILKEAKNPLIISGTHSQSIDIINAASNIANALVSSKVDAGLFYIVPESNSIGLFMIGGKSLDNLITDHELESTNNDKHSQDIEAVFIIENDFYNHRYNDKIVDLFSRTKNIISLGHTENTTTLRSDYILPVTTFAESDGTYINNEGRAQRFFSALPDNKDDIKESWKWIKEFIDISDIKLENNFSTLDELAVAISKNIAVLSKFHDVAPSSEFMLQNAKIPRQTPRFSGRTSMNADINVSEQKTPVDEQTPLNFSMEGSNSIPPSSMLPFYWAPGWNSVQSLNKYQKEIGGILNNSDPGKKILLPSPNPEINFFSSVPSSFIPKQDELYTLDVSNIFGSEFLSSLSPSVNISTPEAFLLLNSSDAIRFNVQQEEKINITIKENSYTVIAKIKDNIPLGVCGLFLRIVELGKLDLPSFARVYKLK